MSIYQQLVDLCKNGELDMAKDLVRKYNVELSDDRALKIMSRNTDAYILSVVNR